MKLSIIMPAYNEEKRIGRTLESYSSFFENKRKEQDLDYEILVAINGTKDKTEQVVDEFSKKNKRIRYFKLAKAGKGFAITHGFERALKDNFDLIGYVDADLATPPEEFWKLVTGIKNYDGAIADRYRKGSKINPAFSFRRIIVSRAYNFIVRILFFIEQGDTQCGAKLFKRKLVAHFLPDLKLTNWAFEINILHSARQGGYRIKSIPTVWFEVQGGNLKIMKNSIQMLFAIIQLRLLRSPFKSFLKVLSPLIGIIYKVIRGR